MEPQDWTGELIAAGFTQDQATQWADPDAHVGVVQTPYGLFIGWIDVAWEGPAIPLSVLRGVTHLPGAPQRAELDRASRHARGLRTRSLAQCRYCAERMVPGHMHGDVCHGCAERHLGVVH